MNPGSPLPKAKHTQRPIEDKYREGKVKSTPIRGVKYREGKVKSTPIRGVKKNLKP